MTIHPILVNWRSYDVKSDQVKVHMDWSSLASQWGTQAPKTAKFGGLRYSENFQKWAKINILRFTQWWYQTEGFDLEKQDLRWETTKNLRNGGFDPLKELYSSILAWIMLNRQWTAAKLTNGVRIEWNLVHRRKNTCWVQWTQKQAPDAIFQDGRRRHLENR